MPMGTDSWGLVTVPLWALRFEAVKRLIDQYGKDLSYEDLDVGEYQFASQTFVRDDEFPERVHETLQALKIPYDYGFALAMGKGGARSGGWRPGMRAPLEYATLDGERVFTQSELRKILVARVPVAVRLARITALVQQREEQLPPVGRWPDPRAVQAQALRNSGPSRTSSRPRRPRRL
jgi:hypothetical protein